MLSRVIFSTTFLVPLGAPDCLSGPLHKLSGNPSAILLDAPDCVLTHALRFFVFNDFTGWDPNRCGQPSEPSWQYGRSNQVYEFRCERRFTWMPWHLCTGVLAAIPVQPVHTSLDRQDRAWLYRCSV